MARLSFLFCVTSLLDILTMRSAAYLLPGLLTSQLPTVAAWMHPGQGRPGSWREHDKLGAVASESSICSDIGTDMLKAGGNAADSMAATVFCVGVGYGYDLERVCLFAVGANLFLGHWHVS